MKKFIDLTPSEKCLVIEKAIEFKIKMKINHDIKIGDYSYPPSGSDMFKPELWKDTHWNWFNDQFKTGKFDLN